MRRIIIVSFWTIIQTSYLFGQIDSKSDSLFNQHILSLKSSIANDSTKALVEKQDIWFLDMFYYLSGLQIGEEQHSYGKYPRYINRRDIECLEAWYNSYKQKISYEKIIRINYLIEKYKSIGSECIENMEDEYKEIDLELDTLRIK